VMAAHLHEPAPRLSELRPDLPPTADGLIAHALAKRPDERYASASALVKDARALLQAGPSIATTPDAGHQPTMMAGGLAAGAAASGAARPEDTPTILVPPSSDREASQQSSTPPPPAWSDYDGPAERPPAYGQTSPPIGYVQQAPPAPGDGTPPPTAQSVPPPPASRTPLRLSVLGVTAVALLLLGAGAFAFISGGGPSSSPTHVADLASASPSLDPTARATATLRPTATPTSEPPLTAAPTAPIATVGATPSAETGGLEADFGRLRELVEIDNDDPTMCTEQVGIDDRAELSCFLDVDPGPEFDFVSLWYTLYDSVPEINAEYDSWLAFREIADDAPDCFAQLDRRRPDLPCEGSYDTGGFVGAGRVAADTDEIGAWLRWTHEPALIHGRALGDQFDSTFGYWVDVGSILSISR